LQQSFPEEEDLESQKVSTFFYSFFLHPMPYHNKQKSYIPTKNCEVSKKLQSFCQRVQSKTSFVTQPSCALDRV